MLLSCPNCGAQYEVPDDAIPRSGRDVECSNCGNTWFQGHPDEDVALAADLEAPLPDDEYTPEVDAIADTEIVSDSVPEPEYELEYEPEQELPESSQTDFESEPKSESDSEPDYDRSEDWPEDESEFRADEAPVDDAPRQRRTLDPSVADLLRQEAEAEARARAEEAGSLETQPDLGLDDTPLSETERRAEESRQRMARMRGELDPLATAKGPATSPDPLDDRGLSRRDLLPDIEEINSTLRSTDDRGPDELPNAGPSQSQRMRMGFRLGFGLVFLIAAIGLLIYVFQAEISASLPQAAPLVDSYLLWVNDMRLWLDTQVTSMMLWLESMSGKAE